MALFQAGKAPLLVFTGGWVPWYPEARPEGEILAERAAVLGVPRRHMLVTPKVTHTADEARAVARHLRELPSTTADAPIIMLIPEAVHLVLHAAALGHTGAVYVLEMGEQIKVPEIARHLIRLAGLFPEEDIPGTCQYLHVTRCVH